MSKIRLLKEKSEFVCLKFITFVSCKEMEFDKKYLTYVNFFIYKSSVYDNSIRFWVKFYIIANAFLGINFERCDCQVGSIVTLAH